MPGPFRPILHLKHSAVGPTTTTRLATIKQLPQLIQQHQQYPKQSSHPLSAENVILRQTPPMPAFKAQTIRSQHQIDVAQQTEKPVYYLSSENSQQSYLQHGHQYQHQLISTTEQPINNNIEEPIHIISVPLKTLNINPIQRPIISNDYTQNHQSQYQRQQQHPQRQPSTQYPANQNRYRVIKAQPVHTNIKYIIFDQTISIHRLKVKLPEEGKKKVNLISISFSFLDTIWIRTMVMVMFYFHTIHIMQKIRKLKLNSHF